MHSDYYLQIRFWENIPSPWKNINKTNNNENKELIDHQCTNIWVLVQ